MKIAISSTGKDIQSEIDPRFGRCHYFVIVDVQDKEIKSFKAIENTATAQAGGAGISAAQIAADQGVNAIITTNMGPRAFDVFEQLDIKIYQADGKIEDAVQKFIKGELFELKRASGPQHMGMCRK
jgi:predicted Fe-Mo cluster-binding NifX family protein